MKIKNKYFSDDISTEKRIQNIVSELRISSNIRIGILL